MPEGWATRPDWSAKIDPVPYAKLGDPQSLNLYSYVLDNPVSSTDPNGHGGPPNQDAGFHCSFDADICTYLYADFIQNPANKVAQAQEQPKLRDVTAGEGEQVLKAAEGMEGTPYKMGGNSKQGIDCIHTVCAALNKAGIDAKANANANNFDKDVKMRPLGPKEQPRTGDIVQWKHQPTGHVGVYDANPSKPGYNIYSATNHGVMHAPASWFSSLGTPTYYRVEVPQ